MMKWSNGKLYFMNVFVINLYFITSVSPVRAGKQTPVIVDVQKKY